MKRLCILVTIAICSATIHASPLPQTLEADSENVNVATVKQPSYRPIEVLEVGQEILPIHFGSVIGEIVVGSGTVDVQRNQPKRRTPAKNEGPSFSKFISGPAIQSFEGREVVLSAGSNKPPRDIVGATLVFSNEAHVAELS